VREIRTRGSVRGAARKGRPYRVWTSDTPPRRTAWCFRPTRPGRTAIRPRIACYRRRHQEDLLLATESIRTSGVRFQSRQCGAGCTDLSDNVVFGEGADGDAWRSFLRVSLSVRNPFDLEAVLFSRKSGNHPAIRASWGHGFVRLSGGA
jgi:hypothetical protein